MEKPGSLTQPGFGGCGAAEQRDPGDSQWGSVAEDRRFKSGGRNPRNTKGVTALPSPLH